MMWHHALLPHIDNCLFMQLLFGPVCLCVVLASYSISNEILRVIKHKRRLALLHDAATDAEYLKMKEGNVSVGEVVAKAKEDTKRLFWMTFVADAIFWPPLQAINFSYIPLRYQVLFMNSGGFVWNIFLSSLVNFH